MNSSDEPEIKASCITVGRETLSVVHSPKQTRTGNHLDHGRARLTAYSEADILSTEARLSDFLTIKQLPLS